MIAGRIRDVVCLVEDDDDVLGIPTDPPEELLADRRIEEVVVVTDHEVDALHPLLQQLVPTEVPAVGVLVYLVGRPDVLVEPPVEGVGVCGEVVVVALADVLPLADGLGPGLQFLEFREHRPAGVGRLPVALAARLEEFALPLFEFVDVALFVHQLAGRIPERLTLLVAHVDVTHRGLPAEDDRPEVGRVGDGGGLPAELPGLLVDVGGDDDRFAGLAGVFQGRGERRQRLAGPGCPLEEDVCPAI